MCLPIIEINEDTGTVIIKSIAMDAVCQGIVLVINLVIVLDFYLSRKGIVQLDRCNHVGKFIIPHQRDNQRNRFYDCDIAVNLIIFFFLSSIHCRLVLKAKYTK